METIAPGPGSPCTTYRAEEFARARENLARHAWARTVYSGIRSRAAKYLGIDRDGLRAFVSRETPLITVRCPACGCGPWYAYSLVNDGETLRCNDCGTAWNHDPDDTSETWNVQAVLRSHRLRHILQDLDAAGIVYRIEGDRRFAEQAAVLVERFTEVFKGYRINKVNVNRWCEENDAYDGKINGWKRHDALWVRKVLQAYDLIRDSGVLTAEQRGRIDRDLVAYARDYFVEGFRLGKRYPLKGYPIDRLTSPLLFYHAIQDTGEAWGCIAACGALLRDLRTLGSVVELFEELLDPSIGLFLEDGTFYEFAADYQIGLLQNLIGIPETLRGNIEPGVFGNPKCALLRRACTWFLDAAFPDGTLPSINDSHVGSRPRPELSEFAWLNYGDPKALWHLRTLWGEGLRGGTDYSLFFRDPDASKAGPGEACGRDSVHLPGMGLMILRDDEDDRDRTMAFLDYGFLIPAGHKHPDYLNFGLWARGLEMVSDMGYNWNPDWARLWDRGVLSHNTVREVADQEEGGRPLVWCVTPGPRMAEAGLPGGSRFLALLPRRGGKPLIVDLFRVSGDRETFTWMMHTRSGDLSVEGVEAFESVEVPEPLRAGRRGTAQGTVTATWAFAGERPAGLRVILPASTASSITVSECPPEEDAIRETHLDGGTPKPGVSIPYRGHLQVTRPGPRALFAAVHVPFDDGTAPAVRATIHPAEGAEDAWVVVVEEGDERLLVLHHPGPGEARWGSLRLEGRAGVVALHGGLVTSLCLAGARSLRYGDAEIERATDGNLYGERRGRGWRTTEIP